MDVRCFIYLQTTECSFTSHLNYFDIKQKDKGHSSWCWSLRRSDRPLGDYLFRTIFIRNLDTVVIQFYRMLVE